MSKVISKGLVLTHVHANNRGCELRALLEGPQFHARIFDKTMRHDASGTALMLPS
jgi:hypothetical protein